MTSPPARPRHRPAPLVAAVAGLLLFGALGTPALAQTDGSAPGATTTLVPDAPLTATTLGPATTTVTRPPATTSVPARPASEPPVTAAPTLIDPAAAGPLPAPPAQPAPTPVDTKAEDSSDEPPPKVAVPPRVTPRAPTAVDQAVTKVLVEQLKAAQQTAAAALAASQAADQLLATLEAEQARQQRRFETLHDDETAAAGRLVEQRQHMRTRAVALYVAGPGHPAMGTSLDINELGRRQVLVETVQAADRRTLDRYLDAKASAGNSVDGIVDRLEDINGKVQAARTDATSKAEASQAGVRSVGPGLPGSQAPINGFAFPVADPHNFASTFGAPRSGGRLHQGNDIFAPYGTPLRAAERGVVSKMGVNSLGGIKLWITGESSTSYYYAHLSAFALNVVDGTVVEPGDVVGFVGNTGNAITTPPHLHFEIHPNGGPAIDPYAILKAADDATRQLAAQQPTPTLGPNPQPVPAGQAVAAVP